MAAGRKALALWPGRLQELRFVQHGENTTFRVTFDPQPDPTPPGYLAERYALRIHGADYNSPAQIESELQWLAALRRDTSLIVPEPLPTLNNNLLTHVETSGVPAGRSCSLLRWMQGELRHKQPRASDLLAVGRLMAQLHAHARGWQPPAGWTRRRLDWAGLLGPDAAYGPLPPAEVWALVPLPLRSAMEAVSEFYAALLQRLGTGSEVAGIIHADLHLWNVLFAGDEARAIDFDDCGWGYWLYDLAVVLADWRLKPAWPQMYAAVLAGYAAVQPFPADQLAFLDAFILARKVSGLLWIVGSAVDDPSFGPYVERSCAQMQQFLDALPRPA